MSACKACNDTGLEYVARKTEAGDYDESFKAPCGVCGRKPAYMLLASPDSGKEGE